MSKTPSGTSPSSAAASQTKSTAKTASAAGANVSSGPKANGTITTTSSNLTSGPPQASNWAKIAAGANRTAPSASSVPSSSPSTISTQGTSTLNASVQPQTSSNSAAAAARSTSSSRQPSISSVAGLDNVSATSASGHGRKPSTADAQPFASSSKTVPVKAPEAAIAFGNVNDSSSILSSSPAQPPLMGLINKNVAFGSIQSAQAKHSSSADSSAIPGVPASFVTSTAGPVEASIKPGVAGSAAKVMPKIDFNSFFQSSGGSPTGSPTRQKAAIPLSSGPNANLASLLPGSQALHASTPPSSSHLQSPGASSRRASTYDNATTATLSPRLLAANLPMQGTPIGGLAQPYPGGTPRPFSPVGAIGNKVPNQASPQGYPSFVQSPSFVPGGIPQHYGMPGQPAFPGPQYGKPNGLPINGQPGGPGQRTQQVGLSGPGQPGASPYLQGRQPSGLGQGHQQNRSLGPNSPRITGVQAQPGMQTPQPFYQGQYPQQQWYGGGYYPYPGYGQQFYPQGPQAPGSGHGQPGRPPVPLQQISAAGHSTPSSPAPSLRPALSAQGSGTWTPSASTTTPGSEVSGPTSSATTPAPPSSITSPSLSSASVSHFRPHHTSNGHTPSISQALHSQNGSTSTPSHFMPHSAHASTFQMPPSSAASPMMPLGVGLNAGATSFSFGTARPAPVISGKAPSKALQIKRPPPKDTTVTAKEKEKLDADSAKETAGKQVEEQQSITDEQTSQEKSIDVKAAIDEKTAIEEKTAADEQKAVDDRKAAEEVQAAEQRALEQKAAEQKAADDRAAAELAQHLKKDAEEKAILEKAEQEKIELEEQLREQEEEAKRIREKQVDDERIAKEKEEAEATKKAKEEAAISAASAQAQAKRLQEEETAAIAATVLKEQEPSISAPMSRQTSSQASTEEASAPATPSGDLSSPPTVKKAIPEPLDLSSSTLAVSEDTIVAPGSALSSARPIADLKLVSYPDAIKSPDPDLNTKAKPGKFRYDRDFLMQFMEICKQKPEQLPSLEAIGMTDEGPSLPPGGVPVSRSTSYGGKARVGSVPSTPVGPRGTVPPNFPRTVSTGFAGMGNFAGGMPGATSEQRFAAATAAAQGGSGGGFALPGRPGSMARTPSAASGPGGIPMGGASGRGMDRSSGRGQRRPRPAERGLPPASSTNIPSDFAPLETSENRWTPGVQTGSSRANAQQDEEAPEFVERKVKGLLNKLTIENFESISKQVLAWADKSAKEIDGRILKQVIALIFEKATDEQTWSEVYARLCLFLSVKVSDEVADQSLVEANGQPTAGGKLFRRYLLTRCQADYERGWAQKESATAAAKSKAADDQAKREAAEKEGEAAGVDKETAIKGVDFSDEYYAAEKAKRRGLGLVRFIGELYKLAMLKERIMHECIKKLIANVENPEEEDIESLCKLLLTVGKQLEDGKEATGTRYMGVYFSRLQSIVDKKNVSSRLEFMILDLMDVRKNGWKARTGSGGPKTIAQIHKDTAREKEEEARRTISQGRGLPARNVGMERGGSRRGQGRDGPSADGWQAAPRPQRAGDLSQLGKIRSTSSSPALLPGFANRQGKPVVKEEVPAAEGRAANPFALLAGGDEAGPSELSPPPSEDAPRRTPLRLQPRTVETSTAESASAEAVSQANVEAEEGEVAEEEEEDSSEMDEATKRSIGNSIKEFLGIKNIEEGTATFESLPSRHRGELAKAFIVKVVDGKATDVDAVVKLFDAVSAASLIAPEVFRDAFIPTVTDLEDIATDAPKAFANVGNLMSAADLSDEDVESLQQSMISNEDDLETIQKRLMDAYRAATSS